MKKQLNVILLLGLCCQLININAQQWQNRNSSDCKGEGCVTSGSNASCYGLNCISFGNSCYGDGCIAYCIAPNAAVDVSNFGSCPNTSCYGDNCTSFTNGGCTKSSTPIPQNIITQYPNVIFTYAQKNEQMEQKITKLDNLLDQLASTSDKLKQKYLKMQILLLQLLMHLEENSFNTNDSFNRNVIVANIILNKIKSLIPNPVPASMSSFFQEVKHILLILSNRYSKLYRINVDETCTANNFSANPYNMFMEQQDLYNIFMEQQDLSQLVNGLVFPPPQTS
jgi:hypothetical protein